MRSATKTRDPDVPTPRRPKLVGFADARRGPRKPKRLFVCFRRKVPRTNNETTETDAREVDTRERAFSEGARISSHATETCFSRARRTPRRLGSGRVRVPTLREIAEPNRETRRIWRGRDGLADADDAGVPLLVDASGVHGHPPQRNHEQRAERDGPKRARRFAGGGASSTRVAGKTNSRFRVPFSLAANSSQRPRTSADPPAPTFDVRSQMLEQNAYLQQYHMALAPFLGIQPPPVLSPRGNAEEEIALQALQHMKNVPPSSLAGNANAAAGAVGTRTPQRTSATRGEGARAHARDAIRGRSNPGRPGTRRDARDAARVEDARPPRTRARSTMLFVLGRREIPIVGPADARRARRKNPASIPFPRIFIFFPQSRPSTHHPPRRARSSVSRPRSPVARRVRPLEPLFGGF